MYYIYETEFIRTATIPSWLIKFDTKFTLYNYERAWFEAMWSCLQLASIDIMVHICQYMWLALIYKTRWPTLWFIQTKLV